MNSQEQKINKIAASLSLNLVRIAHNITRARFKLNPRKVSYGQMSYLLKKRFGSAVMLDSNYFIIPIWQWKNIIKWDWTKNKGYVEDRYDCDNYAIMFAARMGEIHGLNSAPVIYGKYYRDGQFINYHYFNAIIDNEMNTWLLEPQNDILVPYKGEKRISIGNAEYEPLKVANIF